MIYLKQKKKKKFSVPTHLKIMRLFNKPYDRKQVNIQQNYNYYRNLPFQVNFAGITALSISMILIFLYTYIIWSILNMKSVVITPYGINIKKLLIYIITPFLTITFFK